MQQQQQQPLFPPPPPYDAHGNEIYLSEMDSNAWPSSYYGRTRRIDLAKFYFDILKASSDEIDKVNHQQQQQCDDLCSSSSDEEEQISIIQKPKSVKKVTFSKEPPTIFEYEPEYDKTATMLYTSSNNMTYNHTPVSYKNNSLFDEGWPGRTKKAMNSAGFIDFKSKIEAKLGAVNDPALLLALDKNNETILKLAEDKDDNDDKVICSTTMVDRELSQDSRGYYRHRKSPLVQSLNLQPILNTNCVVSAATTTTTDDDPGLLTDNSPSPSISYTDSPITPKDSQDLLLLSNITVIPSVNIIPTADTNPIDKSTTSSLLSRKNSGKWLKSLSIRMKNGPKSAKTKPLIKQIA
ncbi:hypothetical protein BDF20DRAFT_837076 [Mycotypha africana]|uniref:uncharacterized protein n=1 Tax=Mycotypha africana TaxID=64632 RepID=UPI00230087C3|nr:uncharacterized protein BDF20DRAFT_837076 [Mycotypha africana]KAI8975710.1 hypothetical protein BDF20DRAFT_837076 [Mycotypha africana]